MSSSNETKSTLLDEAGQNFGGATRADAGILDHYGRPMQRSRRPAERVSARIESAIRQQPIAAFAIGVGLGLVIGRLTA